MSNSEKFWDHLGYTPTQRLISQIETVERIREWVYKYDNLKNKHLLKGEVPGRREASFDLYREAFKVRFHLGTALAGEARDLDIPILRSIVEREDLEQAARGWLQGPTQTEKLMEVARKFLRAFDVMVEREVEAAREILGRRMSSLERTSSSAKLADELIKRYDPDREEG